ncbi:MAG: hypothetical protein KC983_11915, partial [Phycisphaerales bacterium]|nr:hypothetical protein [Phycisphaerales bacterium]
CRILLESRDRNAVIGVVRQFHRLTPAGRQSLRTASCNVAPALHDIIARGGAHAAANALAMVRDRDDLTLLPIVSDLLEAPSEQLTRDAAGVLRDLIRPWTDRPVTRERSPETLQRIDNALARALETYRHHRESDVLHAAALHAPWPGPKLEVLLGEDDHPAMLALRSVVERVDDPDIRRNLIRWTTSARLSRAVLRWMHRIATPEAFDDVFRHAHLLLNPQRRSAFRGVDRVNVCGPSPLAVGSIAPRAQRDLVRWIDTLPFSAKERIARATMIFATAQRIPRLRVMPRLLAYDDALRQRTMSQGVRDHDHVVARQALRHGLRQPVVDDDVLSAAISREEHAFVRRAMLRTSRGHERAFFAAFDHLDRTASRVLARHHLRHNRERFLAALAAKLNDRDVTRITLLIDLIRGLQLVREFEPALIAMTASASARISASAV